MRLLPFHVTFFFLLCSEYSENRSRRIPSLPRGRWTSLFLIRRGPFQGDIGASFECQTEELMDPSCCPLRYWSLGGVGRQAPRKRSSDGEMWPSSPWSTPGGMPRLRLLGSRTQRIMSGPTLLFSSVPAASGPSRGPLRGPLPGRRTTSESPSPPTLRPLLRTTSSGVAWIGICRRLSSCSVGPDGIVCRSG